MGSDPISIKKTSLAPEQNFLYTEDMEFEIELEGLHLLVLAVTAIAILMADHDGLQYFRGRKEVLSVTRVKRLHYTVMTGLALMILTGAAMFVDRWGELINEPAFYVKMLMVGALVANSFLIASLTHIATQKPFRELTSSEKMKMVMSGGVSGFCWLGAATIGMFFL